MTSAPRTRVPRAPGKRAGRSTRAADPEPTTFANTAAFRAWLRRHGAREAVLVVRLFKVHAAHRGPTYAQALDEALCWGWIDGVRRPCDADTFTVRFTPRKARSTWSRVNVAHAERLIRAGRMARPGLAAFEAREEERTGVYSFERRALRLSPAGAAAFRAEAAAWRFFQARPPWYRRTSTYWVMSAKKPETRAKRLAQLIACSARGAPIPQLARP